MVLDISPFIKIRESRNMCFLVNDIEHYNINEESYHLFMDISFEKG